MVNSAVASLEERLKAEAARLGFAACGFAPAADDPVRAQRLETWLGEGHHGTMEWMETRLHHRRGPQSLWPEAQSVIALGMSYAPAADPPLVAQESHQVLNTSLVFNPAGQSIARYDKIH
ncbi:MAG: hypothetical protein B7Y74_07600, partial [Novosphingobium sp. 35-62-5]